MYQILHIPTALPVYDYPGFNYPGSTLVSKLMNPNLLLFDSVDIAKNFIESSKSYTIASDYVVLYTYKDLIESDRVCVEHFEIIEYAGDIRD